ncbi:unnamed protein product [Heligmosomoides polygyrus]|uniref:Apple domain-containing protein n=1 Tax=Heligmosomoides polygyrus TaxID=6339 RepID=A0A183GND5_HELPZ|nr:unnamed protein product [Heligmosomoides polygyrus]
MSFNLRQDSEDVLQMSSNMRGDSDDVQKTSSKVQWGSDDVLQMSCCPKCAEIQKTCRRRSTWVGFQRLVKCSDEFDRFEGRDHLVENKWGKPAAVLDMVAKETTRKSYQTGDYQSVTAIITKTGWERHPSCQKLRMAGFEQGAKRWKLVA